MRTITVQRRVVTYEPTEVDLLKFLSDCGAEVIPMMETKSLEIRFPTQSEHYTNYVGHIRFNDLKYPLEYAVNLLKNQKQHVVLKDHENEIHLIDHLLSSTMVTIGE